MGNHHLTQNHFYTFGYITSTYAKIEQGLKIIISAMLKVDFHVVAVLCEPYSTLQLRNVISSLNDNHELPNDGNERLRILLGEFKKFSKLRNDIAHRVWVKGTAEGSIKPLAMDIRSGKVKFMGVDQDEPDWTLEALNEEGAKLAKLHKSFIQLTRDLGVSPRSVE